MKIYLYFQFSVQLLTNFVTFSAIVVLVKQPKFIILYKSNNLLVKALFSFNLQDIKLDSRFQRQGTHNLKNERWWEKLN